jgi:non-ribosomal peptide synthetase component F
MNTLWSLFLCRATNFSSLPALVTPERVYTYKQLLSAVETTPITNPHVFSCSRTEAHIIQLLAALAADSLCIFNPPNIVKRLNSPLVLPKNSTGYIFFTSGSSGTPKAVHVPWTAVASVCDAQAQLTNITTSSKIAWVLNAYFDASLSDIFVALLSGAALHIPPYGPTQSNKLSAYIQRENITHLDLPPSCLDLYKPGQLPSLKSVIIGGETPNMQSLHPWFKANIAIFNSYGPTEATISTSLHRLQPNEPIFIGQPYPHVDYLAWNNGNPAPFTPNAVDELLLVSSTCIAKGYLNNPKQTEERFFNLHDKRAYRTGDLIKYCAELHNYQFIGRCDRQFKRHGILICPEEIEAVLAKESIKSQVTYNPTQDKLTLLLLDVADAQKAKTCISTTLGTAYLPNSIQQLTPHLNANYKFTRA